MNKPKKITQEYYSYDDCVAWIEKILGYCLRDTLGKYPDNTSVEYRDYWHFICDELCITRQSFGFINEDLLKHDNEWQDEITQAFIDEFGVDTEYYFDW